MLMATSLPGARPRSRAAHGSLKQAARSLRPHPDTVAYRAQRIEQLTGLDLADPEDRLVAHVAVKIIEGQRSRGPEQTKPASSRVEGGPHLSNYGRLSSPFSTPAKASHSPGVKKSAGPVGCLESRMAIQPPTKATSTHCLLALLRELLCQTVHLLLPPYLVSWASSTMRDAESSGLSAMARRLSKTDVYRRTSASASRKRSPAMLSM